MINYTLKAAVRKLLRINEFCVQFSRIGYNIHCMLRLYPEGSICIIQIVVARFYISSSNSDSIFGLLLTKLFNKEIDFPAIV